MRKAGQLSRALQTRIDRCHLEYIAEVLHPNVTRELFAQLDQAALAIR